MVIDTTQTAIDRFYTLLHWQLAAQLPRPGGVHKYSHGGLISGFTSKRVQGGWLITISNGINYGTYALGFKDDGTRRTARGELETLNFKIIEWAIMNTARLCALPTGGKVVIDL